MVDQQLVGFFQEVDPSISGGKGRNLVILTEAGFPVPHGFVVTYHSYNRYRKEGHMGQTDLEDLVRCYRKLCEKTSSSLVSVRSSASAEDSAKASFAGQYDTYLYVSGEDLLKKRVRNCWDSLYNPTAVAYRKRLNIDDRELKMAVVVQQMIEARSAGILFTRHKYPGFENGVMILESNWGCGETVVSGKATPDHFVIDRDEHLTLQKSLRGEKEVELTRGQSGAIEVSVDEDRRNAFSLNESEIERVCRMGRSVESFLGCPQDIEWAIDQENRLFLLQSRPITKTL